MKHLPGILLIVCLLVVATPGMAADNSELSAGARQMLERYPGLRAHVENGQLRSVYGRAIATGRSAIESAERVRMGEAHVWGVAPEDLEPQAYFDATRRTMQLGYDKATGQYKFTLVYFSQFVGDLPVFESEFRVLVRNEAGYPAVMAKSTLRDVSALVLPVAADIDAERAFDAALEDEPTITDFSEPRQVVFAGTADVLAAPKLAVEFIASVQDHPDEWLFVADAVTGEILHKVMLTVHVDVNGAVTGAATTGVGAEQCGFAFPVPMPYARVTIDGGNDAHTDSNGSFVIPNAGSTDVTVRSTLSGLWFVVTNYLGAESSFAETVTPPGPANFTHNVPNTEHTLAEVNGYYNANLVRDWVVANHPTYPEVANRPQFPVSVNRTDGYCPQNAWYSPGERSINFCARGGGAPNTAWSSVIFHEYGHHLIEAGGSGQGQYGEGMGDVISVLMQDDPGLGYGFYGTDVSDCDTPLRNADNTMQYPCSGTIHTCGQLLSGCVWDTRNELVVTNPSDYLEVLSYLAVNSIPMHSGNTITPQITIDFLVLDDDDGTIDNGTPHYNQICTGFGAHNMDCPPLAAFMFEYPTGRPEFITPDQPTVIAVNAVALVGDPVPGSGTVSYRIGAGAYTTEPMNEVAPNQYEATLPGAPCGSAVSYYFSANAQGGGSVSDPADAPTTAFTAFAGAGTIEVAAFDFESAPGWTEQNAGATNGWWQRGVPVNDPGWQYDPTSDSDGSGQCYLTENVVGNTDVDNGAVLLLSSIFDLSDGGLRISYDYFLRLTNEDGQDRLLVEISSNGAVGPWSEIARHDTDGGLAWRSHEITQADLDAAGVTLGTNMMFRFTANDSGTQSINEAGLDALRIEAIECMPVDSPPFVTADPQDQTVCDGETANFSVSVGGTPPFDYQWFKDAVSIPGAVSSSYSIVGAGAADVAAYSVEITNVFGTTVSADAFLSIVTVAACDDTNACTADSCALGTCINTDTTPGGQCCDPVAGGLTPIDDGDACTNDTCNPDGTVGHTDNYDPATQCCASDTGAVTQIADGNECTDDACNPDGSVSHTDNFDAGTECCNPADGAIEAIDDGSDCTADACDPGTGFVTHVAATPQATDESPKSIAVVPEACSDTVAIRITSPDHTCLDKYADADGYLTDTPVYLTPATWATVHVRGEEIIPESTYTASVELAGGASSATSSAATWAWGDVDNSGLVNFVDINLIVQAFQGDFTLVTFEAANLDPCIPNGEINFNDINQGVAAFQQQPYSATGCPTPCP